MRLNNGGKIVIEVPNAEDALLSLYKIEEFATFYYSIAHLTYFSAQSLGACAKAAKLAGDVTGIQRYDLRNHLYWALHKRPGGQGAFSHVVSQDTCDRYDVDLVASGKSDTLWGVFTKHN